MAPELDVGMGMGMGIGVGMMPMGIMGMDGGASSSFSTAYLRSLPTTDGLPIDDLLDFSNQDDLFDSTVPGYAVESHQSHHPLPSHESAAPAVGSFDTCGSNLSTFSDDLYVPVSTMMTPDSPFPLCSGSSFLFPYLPCFQIPTSLKLF